MRVFTHELIRHPQGGENLAGLTRRLPQCRIFNLHQIWLDQPEDPHYDLFPVFEHPLLNRAIIIKHNLRHGDEGFRPSRRVTVSKLILPLDPNDLSLGGRAILMSQARLPRVLSSVLDYSRYDLDRDMRMLSLLDGLPSFHPYLIDQATRHAGIKIANLFVRIKATERQEASLKVAEGLSPIFRLGLESDLGLAPAPGGGTNRAPSSHRIDGTRVTEAIVAWKCLIYYRRRLLEIAPTVREAASQMRSLSFHRPNGSMIGGLVDQARDALIHPLRRSWRECRQAVLDYDRISVELAATTSVDPVYAFLRSAPKRYRQFGDRLSTLEHICTGWRSVWEENLADKAPDEMCGVLLELGRAVDDGAEVWPGDVDLPAA